MIGLIVIILLIIALSITFGLLIFDPEEYFCSICDDDYDY